MPAKIDRNLLAAIKIEFESGLQPPVVARHLRNYGTPVAERHVYRLYNRWRASRVLVAERKTLASRHSVLANYILEVSLCFCSLNLLTIIRSLRVGDAPHHRHPTQYGRISMRVLWCYTLASDYLSRSDEHAPVAEEDPLYRRRAQQGVTTQFQKKDLKI